MPGDKEIDRSEDVLQRRGEISLFIDVPEELFGEQQLPGCEREHLELFPQVIDKVAALDRDRLSVLQLLVLLAGTADLEAVKENLLPIDFVLLVLLLLLLLGRRLLRRLIFGLQQLQKRIRQ